LKSERDDVYKRVAQNFVAALICQTRLGVTLLVYAVLALLLLTYVSAHVFTSMLSQDIAQLQVQRQQRKETFNKLTGQYISVSSRARVSHYCESVLGMVQTSDRSVQRFALRERAATSEKDVAFAPGLSKTKETRFTLLGKNEKSVDER